MQTVPTSSEIRARARESLTGLWGRSVGVAAIYMVISIFLSFLDNLGSVIQLIIAGPLTLGMSLYFLGVVRKANPPIASIFEGFRQFLKTLFLFIVMFVFVMLWALLLIIPGIIASLRYSQAYFILIDNPDIGVMEAINRSKQMMSGSLLRLFILHLSFIGWALLCIPTLGIGYLWLMPYIYTSQAHFYENLRSQNSEAPQGWQPPAPPASV